MFWLIYVKYIYYALYSFVILNNCCTFVVFYSFNTIYQLTTTLRRDDGEFFCVLFGSLCKMLYLCTEY